MTIIATIHKMEADRFQKMFMAYELDAEDFLNLTSDCESIPLDRRVRRLIVTGLFRKLGFKQGCKLEEKRRLVYKRLRGEI